MSKKYNLLHIPSGRYLYKYPVADFGFCIHNKMIPENLPKKEEIIHVLKFYPYLRFLESPVLNFQFTTSQSEDTFKVILEEFELTEYDNDEY